MLVQVPNSPRFPKLRAADESSPSSPQNFRQLDDVFLQTQTRIWLGEVLRTRLNEERSIADLLADGELLFEVSKEIWKMMLSKPSELTDYEYEPFARRNSGRYMPYTFVDSFLRICKILGLNGIDLFSPSDVVEKGDTRKVCVCIRALSKKAGSLDLNVPDFDNVTYTVAMPTDMVGYIRRSWELSLSEYSNSSSLSQNQTLGHTSSQENLNEACVETQEEEEFRPNKLQGSLFLHQFDNDKQEKNVASLSVVDSNSQSGGSFSHVENGSGNRYRSNLLDRIYHYLNLENVASVVEGSLQSKKTSDENEHTSQFLDGDDFEVSSSAGSVNSVSTYARNPGFDDDLEIKKSFPETTEGYQFQNGIVHTLEQILSTHEQEESLKVKAVNIGLSLPKCFIAHSGKYTSGYIDPVMPYDKNISKSRTNLNTGHEGKEFAVESYFSHEFSRWDQKGKSQTAVVPPGNVVCDALSQSPSLVDHPYQHLQGEVIEGACQHDKINSTAADNGNKDKISEAEQTNDVTMQIAKSKPQRRPLLKAVVGGTAVAGATMLFLHLRNNGGEKLGELGKKSNEVRSKNGRNLSSAKEQNAPKADGVYSSQKLKL